MKKTRLIAMILAHVGVLLAIAYLIFFLIFSMRAASAAAMLDDPQTAALISAEDLYLQKNISKDGFSILTVGRSLSEKTDPGRENFLLVLDLVIPALCLASGILLQVVSVRKKKKKAAVRQGGYEQIKPIRRQS